MYILSYFSLELQSTKKLGSYGKYQRLTGSSPFRVPVLASFSLKPKQLADLSLWFDGIYWLFAKPEMLEKNLEEIDTEKGESRELRKICKERFLVKLQK